MVNTYIHIILLKVFYYRKSGEVLSQNIVPWEIESVNTCSENFLWDKIKNNSIIAVAPGLYEVSCGFYSKK